MSEDSIFSIGMSESSVPGRDVMGQSISYQLSASCHDNSPYQVRIFNMDFEQFQDLVESSKPLLPMFSKTKMYTNSIVGKMRR